MIIKWKIKQNNAHTHTKMEKRTKLVQASTSSKQDNNDVEELKIKNSKYVEVYNYYVYI